MKGLVLVLDARMACRLTFDDADTGRENETEDELPCSSV